MYRWTDDAGRAHYSDRVPPEAAHGRYTLVDSSGRTRQVFDREKTPEEAAAAERSAKQAAQQADRDRALLQIYPHADDLELARANQLQALDQRSAAAHKALTENQATLNELHSREAAAQAEGADASAKLQLQIHSFETSARQTREALDKIEIQRRDTLAQFDADALRYRELTRTAATR